MNYSAFLEISAWNKFSPNYYTFLRTKSIPRVEFLGPKWLELNILQFRPTVVDSVFFLPEKLEQVEIK